MNIQTQLILIKNRNTNQYEDKTAEVVELNYLATHVDITFQNKDQIYHYNHNNILVLKDPKPINIDQTILLIDGIPIRNPSTVLDFGEYIKIIDNNGKAQAYEKSKVSFQDSCLNQKQPKTVFNYFKGLSLYISEDNRISLFKQYEKISKISVESVFSTYLSGNEIKRNDNKIIPIFPFKFNLSQKKAVIAALENSISIIDGPPGNGKTQAILNIIANIFAQGKTVGIVAGSNSAASNVQEKLEKNGYGFITALLGKSNNKSAFFENKQTELPNTDAWAIGIEEQKDLMKELTNISKALDDLFKSKIRIAKIAEEISKLKVEQKYFENHYKDIYIPVSKFSLYKNWSKKSMIDLINYIEIAEETYQRDKLKFKAHLIFKYGIYKLGFFDVNQADIFSSLIRDYYKNDIEAKKKEVEELELRLQKKSYKELLKKYSEISSRLFQSALYKRYHGKSRGKFDIKN